MAVSPRNAIAQMPIDFSLYNAVAPSQAERRLADWAGRKQEGGRTASDETGSNMSAQRHLVVRPRRSCEPVDPGP